MARRDVTIPPLPWLRAALERITEHLALELQAPRGVAPAWDDLEWGVARAVAAMQGISTLLANTLRWRGSAGWHRFLEDQRTQSMAREARVDATLAQLDAAARAAGIALVALKGACLRRHDLYRPGERPMADIDLLARAADGGALDALLARLDFRCSFTTRRHRVYLPAGDGALHAMAEHGANPLKIEVHTQVAEALPASAVELSARLWPVQPAPGLTDYRSTSALMLHLLLHAAGNMRARALRQVQLEDLARLGPRLGPSAWDELFGEGDEGWWLAPPLLLVERYYPGRIPVEILRRAVRQCPPWLRTRARRHRLVDVSWSRIGIQAFPGIEWSRSPAEALRYMRSRILPTRAARAELDLAATPQALPWLHDVRWYGASHPERIVRWLFGRPPRVQTLVSVRAALATVSVE